MTIINYSTAFKALDGYVKYHNSNTSALSNQIRQAMISTAREIIKIHSLSLLKANSVAAVNFENLPPLKTNNVQLAKRANASTRTIQRHLKRLLDANILTQKVWHGSNSGYELWINPNILLVNGKQPVDNSQIQVFKHKNQSPDNQFFKTKDKTTCPHTDSSNTSYINNILIGVNKLKPKETMDVLPPASGYQSRDATSNTFTGYTGWKSPKKNDDAGGKVRRKRVTEQTGAEISESEVARSATLMAYINSLWELSRDTIYKNVFLTDGQIKIAKELLRLWYAPVPDKHLEKVHQVYVERIGLVRKFLDKDPEYRYVQLPNKYFNPKNPSGFTGTKAWYKNHKKRQQEVQLKLILQAQIRRFINNEKKETAKQRPRLELFRQCETQIRKLEQPDLLKQFHASVLNHSTHKFSQLNT